MKYDVRRKNAPRVISDGALFNWVREAIVHYNGSASGIVNLFRGLELHDKMCRYTNGEKRPLLYTLLDIEARSGYSLDALDPRIHRGLDRLPELVDYYRNRCCTVDQLVRSLCSSTNTIRTILATGKYLPRQDVDFAVRVCELMEGRLIVVRREEIRLARRKYRQKMPPELSAPIVPEPVAAPKRSSIDLVTAFCRYIHPRPKRFHIQKGDGYVEGWGEELLWRCQFAEPAEVEAKRRMMKVEGLLEWQRNPLGVEITCMWRESGRLAGRWIV